METKFEVDWRKVFSWQVPIEPVDPTELNDDLAYHASVSVFSKMLTELPEAIDIGPQMNNEELKAVNPELITTRIKHYLRAFTDGIKQSDIFAEE